MAATFKSSNLQEHDFAESTLRIRRILEGIENLFERYNFPASHAICELLACSHHDISSVHIALPVHILHPAHEPYSQICFDITDTCRGNQCTRQVHVHTSKVKRERTMGTRRE